MTTTISEAQVEAAWKAYCEQSRVEIGWAGPMRAALTAAAQAAPDRTVDTTKLNAGQLVQRIMRAMDYNDAGSGGIAKLAEAIAAGILDLPANYWTSAAQAGEEVSPEMIATLKRLDTEPPEATFTSCEDLMTYLDDGPSPAPAPLDKIDHRSIIIHRVARLICYETCRAGLCKDSERCCGGSQSPIRISEERAKELLAPLLGRADDGWDAYSIAVQENIKRHEELRAKYPIMERAEDTPPSPPVQSGDGQTKWDATRKLKLVESGHWHGLGTGWLTRAACEAALEIATLTQALAEAREVIEPFAKMADELDKWVQSNPAPKTPNYTASVGDLRRARAWWERNRTGSLDGEP